MALKNNNVDIMMRILTRRIRPTLRVIVKYKFETAKQWLLDAVRSHPISQDIMSHGPSPYLGSSTGTMFGFMGFDADSQSDPIGDLIEFLDERITYQERANQPGKLFSSSISYPNKDAFAQGFFQLDWTDRGWPVMIEEGISGLPYYLNRESPNSRSEEGVQTSKPIRSKDWQGQPYLTPLFAEFRQKLLL